MTSFLRTLGGSEQKVEDFVSSERGHNPKSYLLLCGGLRDDNLSGESNGSEKEDYRLYIVYYIYDIYYFGLLTLH